MEIGGGSNGSKQASEECMSITGIEVWSAVLAQVLAEEAQTRDRSGLTAHQRLYVRSSVDVSDQEHAERFKVKVSAIRKIRRRGG